jgi:hypothetical protein
MFQVETRTRRWVYFHFNPDLIPIVASISVLWGARPCADIQTPFRDGKRVLECLQKALRIASSCIDELTSVQLYVDTLDRYIYYFEQGVEAVTPKYVNSLVELITSNIDSIYGTEGLSLGGSGGNAPGLVDGVNSPEMIVKVCPALTPG